MIGHRLKILRGNIYKDQDYIAKKINVARNTYTRYENESRTPTIETLCKLALFYDVSLDYIFGLKKQKSPYGNMVNYNEKKFIANIKFIRKKLNYTQLDIANLFSCDRVTVARYENGTYKVPIDYLIKLSTLSKIPTDYLVGIIQKTF